MGAYADIQILERNSDNIVLSWEVDTATNVTGFQVYVSTDPLGLNPVWRAVGPVVPNAPSGNGYSPKHVVYSLTETVVRALGGTFATAEFTITPLYIRAATIIGGVSSGATGAVSKPLQALYSAPGGRLGSLRGASYVSMNPLNDDNITIERTLAGTTGAFNVTQELIYLSGEPSGTRAKLIVYTGPFSVDGKATRVDMYDTLKP